MINNNINFHLGLEIDEFGNFLFTQVAYDRIVVYDSTGTDTGYRINAPGGSSSWDPWCKK